MKILIATSNPGKLKQMETYLNGVDLEFFSLKNFDIKDAPYEDGETFEKNALIKAKFYFEKTKMPTIAEDSGILVDALPNELGVKTRRWGAGEKASDKEWISYFLEKMKNLPINKRGAKFISCITFVTQNLEKTFHGECIGTITKTLEAEIKEGIPLSSCFKPFGYDRVYSALNLEEKIEVSHRGKAAMILKKFLINFINEKSSKNFRKNPRI
jgi:XTP/dITP diphosphohydrolase